MKRLFLLLTWILVVAAISQYGPPRATKPVIAEAAVQPAAQATNDVLVGNAQLSPFHFIALRQRESVDFLLSPALLVQQQYLRQGDHEVPVWPEP
jgi:hypothetical protein